ncbi:MAG: M20 family metallo-hydrolase [Deltaproteobacteria bacterium]|nr:M20 family metallo-hydrolase [Deltaproteobacteria bacterium]
MDKMKDIYERIDGYRDEVIELQRDLCARVALGPLNGGSGEHEKMDFIKELLSGMKPDHMEEIRAPDEKARDGYRPNLIARWKGLQDDPVVWVLAHADIVPPGNLSLWECDPYCIKVDGDRIIGRGVEDNQHGFVSAYLALKAILDSHKTLKRSVGLIIVADEETGSRYGLSYMLKHHGDIFSPEDLIIVPDAGNEDGTMIEIAEKSMLWLKFTINGRQCHASTPHKGKNSLVGAARLIVALGKLKEKFAASNPLFSPPVSTFEPTKIEANVSNVNTIPGRDVFYADCRILPEHNVDEVIETAQQTASRVAAELALNIELESEHRHDAPLPTPATSPVVAALKKAVMNVTGREAKPMGIGGGTVAAFFREAGLPAAVWSTCPDTAHQPNEYCLISQVITDAKVFAAIYQEDEST